MSQIKSPKHIMLLAGHAVAGALIGQQLQTNPILIFVVAFISHFLLDLIPHGDGHLVKDYFNKQEKLKTLYNIILYDTLVTIVLVVGFLLYSSVNKIAVTWGIIGSVFPDFIVGLNETFKSRKLQWFNDFHYGIHNALIQKINVPPMAGAIVQLIIIIYILFYI